MKKIWVLNDDRIGSNKQATMIASTLSNNYIIKNIKYNSFIKLPNFIRGASLIGVNKESSDNISDDLPDIIISAGRRLSCVALNIKNRNKNIKIITILNPNYNFNKFDLIILPIHDNITGKNIINCIGSFVSFDNEKIKLELKKWDGVLNKYKKPLITILIGGDTKNKKFSPKKINTIIDIKLKNEEIPTLLITTSRRTSNSCITSINEKLSQTQLKYFLYDWNKNQGQNNPYLAMLWNADYLLITGDSISMICEACGTGKPVYIYMPKETLSPKHYNFCRQIIDIGYAREFNPDIPLEKYNYKPLNETFEISKKIKEVLSL
jgi:mitochondrial fission protein ELM1